MGGDIPDCSTSNELLELPGRWGLELHDAPVFGIRCRYFEYDASHLCATSFEADASTVYTVVGRLLDCLYRLRGSCTTFFISFYFVVTGKDGRRNRYDESIYIDPRCDLGILMCWSIDDASLAMLVDPLRGEDLVEVDEGLYLDKALAECLSKGGKCGEIRVERRVAGLYRYYSIHACNEAVKVERPSIIHTIHIIRVFDANKLPPSVVAGVVRRFEAGFERLDIDVHCRGGSGFTSVGVSVLPGGEAGSLNVDIVIYIDNDIFLSKETHVFLHSFLCLARALDGAGPVEFKHVDIEEEE